MNGIVSKIFRMYQSYLFLLITFLANSSIQYVYSFLSPRAMDVTEIDGERNFWKFPSISQVRWIASGYGFCEGTDPDPSPSSYFHYSEFFENFCEQILNSVKYSDIDKDNTVLSVLSWILINKNRSVIELRERKTNLGRNNCSKFL